MPLAISIHARRDSVRSSGLRLPWGFVLAPPWSPVGINQRGPFDFMDTGSQITVVDPLLALELRLKPQSRMVST